MKSSQLANIVHGTLVGADTEYKNISLDSRTVNAGDCFFAIKGEFFDGHDFIADVAKKNIAAAVIDHDMIAPIPLIKVNSTRDALIRLANFYRKNTHIPVAAITGSCGKTTVRALLENILKQKGDVLASKKSFNNDIGLPLTLLQLNAKHDFAVLEIGTNHPGEIAHLTEIAKPTIATVTLAAPVHIEYFKDVEDIAREKGAIFEGLTHDGIAVINADDAFAELWKKMSGSRRVITFGCSAKSDVSASNIQSNKNGQTTFILHFPTQNTKITLPLLGEHNVINALSAAAMAFGLNISIEKIKIGLESVAPEYGRLVEKKSSQGAIIIDDSYNANPLSVKAAIRLLTHRSSHSILVLGDMGELGNIAEKMHTEIGEFAKQQGVQQLFCYGKNTALTAKAFGGDAHHFDDQNTLVQSLKSILTKDATVLVKGSRSMKMEKIVEALTNNG